MCFFEIRYQRAGEIFDQENQFNHSQWHQYGTTTMCRVHVGRYKAAFECRSCHRHSRSSGSTQQSKQNQILKKKLLD